MVQRGVATNARVRVKRPHSLKSERARDTILQIPGCHSNARALASSTRAPQPRGHQPPHPRAQPQQQPPPQPQPHGHQQPRPRAQPRNRNRNRTGTNNRARARTPNRNRNRAGANNRTRARNPATATANARAPTTAPARAPAPPTAPATQPVHAHVRMMRMYKAATIAQSTPHGYLLALSGISSAEAPLNEKKYTSSNSRQHVRMSQESGKENVLEVRDNERK